MLTTYNVCYIDYYVDEKGNEEVFRSQVINNITSCISHNISIELFIGQINQFKVPVHCSSRYNDLSLNEFHLECTFPYIIVDNFTQTIVS